MKRTNGMLLRGVILMMLGMLVFWPMTAKASDREEDVPLMEVLEGSDLTIEEDKIPLFEQVQEEEITTTEPEDTTVDEQEETGVVIDEDTGEE